MLLHIAIHKDENTGYGVTVPSLPGCFSYGDTLEQAIEESKQAILFHIEGLLEDGIKPEINQPNLAALINDPEYAGAQWCDIEVNIDDLTLKPERFNVIQPKYILRTKLSQLPQEECARKLEISQAAYSRLETLNKPRKTTRNKIATALAINPEQLYN